MLGSFFEQLGTPEPDVNLEVGSGTQAEQTARIMERYEALLLDCHSDRATEKAKSLPAAGRESQNIAIMKLIHAL